MVVEMIRPYSLLRHFPIICCYFDLNAFGGTHSFVTIEVMDE